MNESISSPPPATDNDLAALLGSLSKDPYRFVLAAFPWGKGDLAGKLPEKWQADLLKRVSAGLITYQQAIQEAVSSGHGVGKSALVSWLILWSLSTFEDTRGVVTANTATQLTTKTWPELATWHGRFIAKSWFTVTATSIFSNAPGHEKTWRMDAIPWSITNTEAFAGLHNHGKRIVIIFDEASAIHDKIWEVTDGATTDIGTQILWFAFGNPTRNTGRFHACFHRLAHRWIHSQVDSRHVGLTDKTKLQKWEEDYGENSDFFKVRVKGEFPATGDRQFISTTLVDSARGKHIPEQDYNFAPVILSCDPAWTGADELVIAKRQGLASTILMHVAKNDDDTAIAGRLARFEDEFNADAVFIDIGYGTGIYSAGKLMNRRWQLVSFGSASDTPGYVNKRAEMWGLMKDWLKEGGALPDDPTLCEEIPGPEYEVKLNGLIQLESKEDMKERGLSSPNRADALALTFAYPVRKKLQNDPKRKPDFAEAGEYKLYEDAKTYV